MNPVLSSFTTSAPALLASRRLGFCQIMEEEREGGREERRGERGEREEGKGKEEKLKGKGEGEGEGEGKGDNNG